MTSKPQLPLEIPGGCLCGSIRYTITIPEGTQLPLLRNGTCQCTQCRKFAGSLLCQDMTVPTAWISPPLSSTPTFKSYESSSKARRSFCGNCGSSLAFNYKDKPEQTEIYLGTIDEDTLCGKKVEGSGKRVGGVGLDLATPDDHMYMENAIPGLTDGVGNYLDGKKYPRSRDDSEPY